MRLIRIKYWLLSRSTYGWKCIYVFRCMIEQAAVVTNKDI